MKAWVFKEVAKRPSFYLYDEDTWVYLTKTQGFVKTSVYNRVFKEPTIELVLESAGEP